MKISSDNTSLTIPPGLLEEIQAEAERERLPADSVLHHILTRGLDEWRKEHPYTPSHSLHLSAEAKRDRAGAVARIRELRKGNVLPEGVTIEALIEEGRA